MADDTSGQARIGQSTDAQGDVDAIVDQIDIAIVQEQLDLDVLVPVEKARDDRCDMAAAELHGCRDAQEAAHGRLAGADGGVLVVGNERPGTLIEGTSRLGRRQAPRRAVDQPDTDAILQCRQGARHGGRRAAQPLSRTHQAALFHDPHEDRELIETVHVIIPNFGIMTFIFLQLSAQCSPPMLQATPGGSRC